MEIIERLEDHTIWQSRDAEGRTVYAASRNAEDGAPVEPITGWLYDLEPLHEFVQNGEF